MAITVADAAERLGVSAHEVRRLVEAGTLSAERVGRMLLLDERSVMRRARAHVGRGRTLAPGTAWAALWEASGERAGWLDRGARSRLRSWLRTRSPEHIAAGCRTRAVRADVRVLPGYRAAVLAETGVVAGGMTQAEHAGADILGSGDIPDEVYCSAGTWARLRRDYGVSEMGEVNLVVRIPRFDDPELLQRTVMPDAVVAVDLFESADLRTQRAGLALLEQSLAAGLS